MAADTLGPHWTARGGVRSVRSPAVHTRHLSVKADRAVYVLSIMGKLVNLKFKKKEKKMKKENKEEKKITSCFC